MSMIYFVCRLVSSFRVFLFKVYKIGTNATAAATEESTAGAVAEAGSSEQGMIYIYDMHAIL